MDKREMPMDSDLVRVALADVPESVLLKLKEHIRRMEAAEAFKVWMGECGVNLEVKEGEVVMGMEEFMEQRNARMREGLRWMLWGWLGTKGVKEGEVALFRVRERNWFGEKELEDKWLKRWAKVVGFRVSAVSGETCMLSLRMEREDGEELLDEFVGDVQVLTLKA